MYYFRLQSSDRKDKPRVSIGAKLVANPAKVTGTDKCPAENICSAVSKRV